MSPIFRGFVNESLPIWLIKNESVPLDVSVVLSRGQKGQYWQVSRVLSVVTKFCNACMLDFVIGSRR